MTNRRSDGSPGRGGSVGDQLDRIRELETENALLRARVAELNRRIDQQIVAGVTGRIDEPTREVPAAQTEADEDESMDAFEAFLAESDPHIDRVQRFLLG